MLMRINVVSFLDPYVYHGSGELNIRRSLEVGESRGHVIRMSTVRPQSRELHASPLISLLIDVFNHAHSVKSLGAWREFGVGFLRKQSHVLRSCVSPMPTLRSAIFRTCHAQVPVPMGVRSNQV